VTLAQWGEMKGYPLAAHRAYARAIEVEVRKQEEALIQKLVEVLENADRISGYPNYKKPIAAGRARLESKP